MGTDPLLGDSPLLVPTVLAAVLLALAMTTSPVLRRHEVTVSRARAARWTSLGVIVLTVPVALTQTAEGMHGFILLAGLIFVSAATLLRARRAAF